MFDKVDVRPLVAAHLRTLRSFQSGRPAPGDYLLFLVVPSVIATVLVLFGVRLPSQSIGIMVAALAVFAGLFFNLVLLVADLATRTEDVPSGRSRRTRIRSQVLVELHANVSFAVLLSVVALGLLAALTLEGPVPGRRVAEGLVFLVAMEFFLTLLMILKRVNALIASDVHEVHKQAS